MTLLQQIAEDATVSEVPPATVLHRCKILAHRLRYEPLGTWADLELNGYPRSDDVPDYRRSEMRGHAIPSRHAGHDAADGQAPRTAPQPCEG
ncbi:MAG: hypothetical protein AB1416_00295 [Actinomycetota bacterium]